MMKLNKTKIVDDVFLTPHEKNRILEYLKQVKMYISLLLFDNDQISICVQYFFNATRNQT